MNDLTERLADLAAITDADAARLVSDRTHADLAARITTAAPEEAGHGPGLFPAAPAGRNPGARTRRRWLAGLPVAAAAAAAIALVVVFGIQPGHPAVHHPHGQPAARVLAFIRHGRYIDVIVRNPYADPRRYRAEFRAHHLNISLRLVPASPSLVGTVVFFEGRSLKVITAKGRCFTGGGGDICPIGFRVPVHYRGSAELVFGRPARRGEKYETTVPATSEGEALYGLRIDGRHVGTVLRLLRTRHQTVGVYNITTSAGGKLVHHVPLSWFVYEADPWAPGQVMLFADPTRRPPPVPVPSSGQPQPTPTRAADRPAPSPTPSSG